MRRLFIDLDDTVKDTEVYIRRMLKLNGMGNLLGKGTVYNLIGTEYDYIVKECLCNYMSVPYVVGAKESMDLLSTEFEIIFASAYRYEKEAEEKRKFAQAQGKEIILCDSFADKSHIPMSKDDCVIDDRCSVLNTCNAGVKLEMYNPYIFSLKSEREEGIEIVNWFTATDILMNL